MFTYNMLYNSKRVLPVTVRVKKQGKIVEIVGFSTIKEAYEWLGNRRKYAKM